MSSARCSSCHCFSRNCPQGQPNHKTVATVGSSCTMNSLGRHYRDPNDPCNPSCNYEMNGIKCTFYATSEFAALPYPEDISLGPLSQEQNQQPSELSLILSMLTKQKEEQAQQAAQMKTLQDQMSTLLCRDTSVSTTITTTTPSVVSTTAVTSTAPSASLSGGIPFAQEVPSRHPIPPNYHPQPHLLPEAPLSNPIPPNGHPQPQTIPRSVSAAASNLAATLQACLAGESGYGGLTMEHLRANPPSSYKPGFLSPS